MQTPLGELPAELVMFFETGELKRIFPLDGESMITEGLTITFDYSADTVQFTEGENETTLPVSTCAFTIAAHSASTFMYTPADCAGCSLGCR